MRKFLSILLLAMALLLFATWQYRLLTLLIALLLNKKSFKPKTFKYLACGLALGIFIAIPNYTKHGNTVLVYLDKDGNEIKPPLLPYVANVMFPEEEIMNIGMKVTAMVPPTVMRNVMHINSRLVEDARKDILSQRIIGYYLPYNALSLHGSNPGSFTIAQTINQIIDTGYDAIYLTNRSIGKRKENLPVVFFCHGYLGGWELYQGLFSKLDECLVVSIGTKDLSGIFGTKDIKRIFTKYIPYLKKEGYDVDDTNLHLIGLSNGGSAADIALGNFSDKFKSITYMSTGCNVTKHTKTKVLMIGGGKDVSSSGLPGAKRKLDAAGTKTAILFEPDENHFILVNQSGKVFDFLNKEMGI
jgi:hypothetical protein